MSMVLPIPMIYNGNGYVRHVEAQFLSESSEWMISMRKQPWVWTGVEGMGICIRLVDDCVFRRKNSQGYLRGAEAVSEGLI